MPSIEEDVHETGPCHHLDSTPTWYKPIPADTKTVSEPRRIKVEFGLRNATKLIAIATTCG